MSTGVTSGVPFNPKQATPARNNVRGTPAKSPQQTTPAKSPANGTPAKSPGQVTPAKSPKITKTPEKSPQAQLTPSKSQLLSVEKGQRKGSITSIVGGSRHGDVAVLSESLLARTMSLNGPASVANGSGPLSQANGASTLVNADGYRWDDRDIDDVTLEMITDVGEDTGDEEVSLRSASCILGPVVLRFDNYCPPSFRLPCEVSVAALSPLHFLFTSLFRGYLMSIHSQYPT